MACKKCGASQGGVGFRGSHPPTYTTTTTPEGSATLVVQFNQVVVLDDGRFQPGQLVTMPYPIVYDLYMMENCPIILYNPDERVLFLTTYRLEV